MPFDILALRICRCANTEPINLSSVEIETAISHSDDEMVTRL